MNGTEIYRIGQFLGMVEYIVHKGQQLDSHVSMRFYVTSNGAVIPSIYIRGPIYALVFISMIVSTSWIYFSAVDIHNYDSSALIARLPIVAIVGILHNILLINMGKWIFNRNANQLDDRKLDDTTPATVEVNGITIQTKVLSNPALHRLIDKR